MVSDVRIGKAARLSSSRRWRAYLSYKDGKGQRQTRQVYWAYGTVGDKGPIEADKKTRIDELLPELEQLDIPADSLVECVKRYRDIQLPLKVKKGKLKRSSAETAMYHANALILVLENPSDGLGNYTLRNFEKRRKAFEYDLLNSKSKLMQEHGQSHRRKMFYFLKNVFAEAKNDGLLPENPMANMEPPEKPKQRMVTFHDREEFIREFVPRLEALNWPMFTALVYSYCYAGLRKGEGLSLKWTDVQFGSSEKSGYVDVWTSSRQSESTKGGEHRFVPLCNELEIALLEWRDLAPKVEGDYIFVNPDHSLITKDQARGNLEKLLLESGLGKSQPFQKLRRSFASWLAQKGENPFHLQNWMGHKKLETTMRYYAGLPSHLIPDGGRLTF